MRRLVPDERDAIEAALRDLADVERCSLILTTGGTGPSPRDVTPEATQAVCDRLMPGFGELMRARSLLEVPTAILSRQIAGLRGRSLIVNLPGKPAAIRTCLDAVFPGRALLPRSHRRRPAGNQPRTSARLSAKGLAVRPRAI